MLLVLVAASFGMSHLLIVRRAETHYRTLVTERLHLLCQ